MPTHFLIYVYCPGDYNYKTSYSKGILQRLRFVVVIVLVQSNIQKSKFSSSKVLGYYDSLLNDIKEVHESRPWDIHESLTIDSRNKHL